MSDPTPAEQLAVNLMLAMTTGAPLIIPPSMTSKPKAGKVGSQPNVTQWLEPVLLSDDLPTILLNAARLIREPAPLTLVPHLTSALTLTPKSHLTVTRCQSAHEYRTACRSILNPDGQCPSRKDHTSLSPIQRQRARLAATVTNSPTPSGVIRPAYAPVACTVPSRPAIATFRPTKRETISSTIVFTDPDDAQCYAHRKAGIFWCEACA